jgi:hypothetical protein
LTSVTFQNFPVEGKLTSLKMWYDFFVNCPHRITILFILMV